MFSKKISLLVFTLFLFSSVFAQQETEKFCGYTGNSAWLDWYQRNTGVFQQENGADTSWLYVPVTVHIVGTNSGTGYFDFEQAIRAICEMNSQYAPAYVRFYLMPGDEVRYHDNSDWYNHDWDGGEQMINSVLPGIRNRLNAFVVADPAGNCGYSWKDAIVLKKSCSNSGNSTWAHEAGHHFSLPHPFRGWENFDWDYDEPAPLKVNNRDVEKTDGSNCYIGGDRFCDTDPDYLSDRWSCNNQFKSTIVQHDPDSVSFRSDATLIMGYASDHCASRFTEEQIAAVRANLRDEHKQYLQISAPLEEIDDLAQVELISPIDTTETVQYNHIELKWNPVPNAKFYTVEVSLVKSFTVKFYNETLENATSVVITSGIPNNRNLYWRVRAYNSWDVCQPFDQAQTGIFRTQNLSATNELERSAIIQLAPNPVIAGTPARLNIESEGAMDLSVSLSDAAGRICYQQRHRLSTGQNQLEISTAHLGPGLYTVLMQNEKGTIVKRLAIVE